MEGLLGKRVPRNKDGLNRIFAYVKGDVESLDEKTGSVGIEVKDSNHPDIWSVEGIARSLRGYLGYSGSRALKVSGKSKLNVIVDKRLLPIRPYIATAIVRGARPSEEALKSWIGLQEKMDQTYGRKRKKASIGFYQADLVNAPLNYTVRNPDTTSFAPLGSSEKMSLRRIVKEHPKGQEYGSIISSFKEWPLLVDGEGQILSLPPVINSNDLGQVTTETRNILVEVTGTSLDTVHDTLKTVVSALAERRGKIYTCVQTYRYKPGRTTTPDMAASHSSVSLDEMNRMIGTPLSASQAVSLLKKAGYGARLSRKGKIGVDVPPHRLDIMHPVDLIEDAAIAFDLNNLKPEWPKVWTPGGLVSETEREEAVAELMVGLGYQEVATYALVTTEALAAKGRSPRLFEWDEWKARNAPPRHRRRHVEIANLKVFERPFLRDWLLPSLLEFLSSNTHVGYPQRIFEIGLCERLGGDGGDDARTVKNLAAVSIHDGAGFTEIRSSLDSLLDNLGIEARVEPQVQPSFLEGRFGGVVTSNGRNIGFVGELNPQVILAWGLGLPAVALELDMAGLNA